MSELTVGTLSGLAANSYVIDVASGSSLDLSAGAVLPSGSVIQVVSANRTSTTSTSSASFVSSNLTASITPSLSTSKVFAVYSVSIAASPSVLGVATVFRGDVSTGTNLGNGNAGMSSSQTAGEIATHPHSASFLDSPNTSSATTYTLAIRASGASITAFESGTQGTLTLMEVAG